MCTIVNYGLYNIQLYAPYYTMGQLFAKGLYFVPSIRSALIFLTVHTFAKKFTRKVYFDQYGSYQAGLGNRQPVMAVILVQLRNRDRKH